MSKLAGDTDARGPAKIVDIKDNKIIFDAEQLEDVLKDYGNKKIAVIAVAGAYRTGKSFLLSYIMKALTSSNESWIGDTDSPLDRWFPWKSGSSRMTTGIDLLTEPIPFKLKSGEEIGVILMDTQGTVDPKSKTKESAAVFSLSTLVSSMLIYNIRAPISLDDLQNLQMWLGYGKLALEKQNTKPFQDMMFLVRDWQCKDEHRYGKDGGRQYITELFTQIPENEHKELENIQTEIEQCFTNMSCFLLPHPGLSVPCKPEYDGSLKGLEVEFVQHLTELLQLLISKHITIKSINGAALTGKDLLYYFKEYTALFENGEMPEPLSIVRANAKVYNTLAVEKCMNTYQAEMEKHIKPGKPLNTSRVTTIHTNATQLALETFDKASKMGGSVIIEKYKTQLMQKMREKYMDYEEKNKRNALDGLHQAIQEEFDTYHKEMSLLCNDKQYIRPISIVKLEKTHKELKEKALTGLTFYCEIIPDHYATQKQRLENNITKLYENSIIHNQRRVKQYITAAVQTGLQTYDDEMASVLRAQEKYTAQRDLQTKHDHLLKKVLEEFNKCRSLMPDEHDEQKNVLKADVEKSFKKFRQYNERKAILELMCLVQEESLSYGKAMFCICNNGRTSVATTELDEEHKELSEKALKVLHVFSDVVPDEYQKAIFDLENKLDHMFEDFKNQRKTKAEQEVVLVALEQSKMYCQQMTIMIKNRICVPPKDLKDKHTELMDKALEALAKYREVAESEYQRQKSSLINDIEQMFGTYNQLNEKNLEYVYENAFIKARNEYQKCMEKTLEEGYVEPNVLIMEHKKLKIEAFDKYEMQCISNGAPVDESTEMQLSCKIEEEFVSYKQQNKDNKTSILNRRNMILLGALGAGLAIGAAGATGASLMLATPEESTSLLEAVTPFIKEAAAPLIEAATPLIQNAWAAVPIIAQSWLKK